MYVPPLFNEGQLPELHGLIRANPFGLLVSAGEDGPVANPVPFVLDGEATPLGALRAHLARANPQWRSLVDGQMVLVVFQGPERYVTPSWYASKRETGKVVPTWNYAMVQARGPVRVVDERDWLARNVADLTEALEHGRAEPWTVDDAPPAFIEAQLKGIVGIEIAISAIEGKWKVSQNRTAADRAGVVAGLVAEGDDGSLAMARLVDERRR
jgi:transcriptional regulator